MRLHTRPAATASFPANSSSTRIPLPSLLPAARSPTLFPSRRDATPSFSRLLPVNSLFDEGPSRMRAITGSSSAELQVSQERETRNSRVRSETMRRGSTISNGEVPSFFFFSSLSLSLSSVSCSLYFHLSMEPWMDGWMDGWMDEWMDGWMEKQRNRRDIPLFANSIDHDS